MRLLLDTHAFLWWVSEGAKLSKMARKTIGDGANECYFSMASAWELAIEVSLGRLTVAGRLDRVVRGGASRATGVNGDAPGRGPLGERRLSSLLATSPTQRSGSPAPPPRGTA